MEIALRDSLSGQGVDKWEEKRVGVGELAFLSFSRARLGPEGVVSELGAVVFYRWGMVMRFARRLSGKCFLRLRGTYIQWEDL